MKLQRTAYDGVFFVLPSIAWDHRKDVNGVWFSWLFFQFYLDFQE